MSPGVKCVHVDGVLSSWSQMIPGVPQDGLFVPPLPTIGINDLPDVVNSNTTFALCADVAKCSRKINK